MKMTPTLTNEPVRNIRSKLLGDIPENSIYYILFPMAKFFKLCGLYPLKATVDATGMKMHFQLDKLAAFFTAIAFVFFGVGFAHAVRKLHNDKYEEHQAASIITYIATWTQIYSLFLLGVFGIVATWWNVSKTIRLFADVFKIDRRLELLGLPISYKKMRTHVFGQICAIMWVPILFSMVNCIVILVRFKGPSMCYFFICFGPIFYITFRQFAFYNMMILYKTKVNLINMKLKQMAQFKDFSSNGKTEFKFQYVDYILDKSLSVSEDDLTRTVMELAAIHSKISENLKTVMEIYSWHLVLVTMASFSVMTIQSYNVFALIVHTIHMHVGNIIITFVWITLQGATIWINVSACYKTTSVMALTGPILHTIRGHYQYDRFVQAIQSFSLEILHRNITFTAGGFFNMDYKLITSIVAAVTTYLVIMIQFHISTLQLSNQHSQ